MFDQNRSYMECGVCQDKATGIHYGLATCEGCKGRTLVDLKFKKTKIFFSQDFLNEQFKIKRNIDVSEMVHVSSINLNVIVVNIVDLLNV